MDEMKIKLHTKFMRGIVAKLLSKIIFKNTGCEIDIRLNEIGIETVDSKIHLHVDADANIDKDEFVNLLKKIGLD